MDSAFATPPGDTSLLAFLLMLLQFLLKIICGISLLLCRHLASVCRPIGELLIHDLFGEGGHLVCVCLIHRPDHLRPNR